MHSNSKNFANFIIRFLVICSVLNDQVSAHSIANRTGKGSLNRKNDKLIRYFTKDFDELSKHGSELRHSERTDQKLNISLTVSEPFNEFTEMRTQESYPEKFANEFAVKQSECQCSCDPYQKANQLISDYVLNDEEDPDMDVDDNEELEKLQKPYKYIPMETIELAHQRPQRVTSTLPPPTVQKKISNLFESLTTYLSLPKFGTKEYLELGVSLFVTGALGYLGFSPQSIYNTIRRMTTSINRDYQHHHHNTPITGGYYQNYYSRQLNDSSDDLISTFYDWIQSL